MTETSFILDTPNLSHEAPTMLPSYTGVNIPNIPKSSARKAIAAAAVLVLGCLTVLPSEARNTVADTEILLQNSLIKPIQNAPAWLSVEARQWCCEQGLAPFDRFNQLDAVISQIFGPVEISTKMYRDFDEDWVNIIISIASGLDDDFDAQLEKESKLFLEIEKSEPLTDLLSHLIIRQI